MAYLARAHFQWQLRTRSLSLGERTCIMGIVNVTPDSFSDGGRYAGTERAVAHALQLLDDGADILDIGGESTRPGSPAATSDAISTAEEQDRVLPVIESVLRKRPDALVSVDTYRAATAHAAVMAGAELVNDVSGGLWDAAMFPACAELQCGVIVMHARGLPMEWPTQVAAPSRTLVSQIQTELQARVVSASATGVARERIVVDPGFGFGKRGAENWLLLREFDTLAAMQRPLMAGLSRKGFLTSTLPAWLPDSATARDALTHAANNTAILGGAHMVRVHDVRGAVLAAAAADAVLNGTADYCRPLLKRR